MDVHDAAVADAKTIAGLLGELGYPTSPSSVSEQLALLTDEDRVLLAQGGVGLVSLHRVPLLAEGGSLVLITALVVTAGARRRGVAAALIAAAEEAARSWGCSIVEVSSARRPERDAAHALYRSLGFRDTVEGSVCYWKLLA